VIEAPAAAASATPTPPAPPADAPPAPAPAAEAAQPAIAQPSGTAPSTAAAAPAAAALAPAPVPQAAVPSPEPRAPAGEGRAQAAEGREPAAAIRQGAPGARPEEGRYRKLLASAERKYEAGKFLDSIGDYRRALAARATGPAHVGLARALYDSNRSADALREVESAIQLDGRYAPAWLLLGEIHQGEGRLREARAAYERFLQLDPKGEQAQAVREIIAKQLR
jgi:tetratricopeptide (TPR) repeat protein